MVSKTCIGAAVCVIVCTLSSLCAGQNDSRNDYFITNGIVPDLLSAPPPGIVTVLYKGGVSVNMCSQIDPRKLKEPPAFAWEFREGVNYTLIMIDPDAPSRDYPLARSLIHMLAVNITSNFVYGSDVLYDYAGPSPVIGTGLHRYVFLVYEQSPTAVSVPSHDTIPIIGRLRFSLNDFVQRYNLVGPIAGNCFVAEFSGF